MKQPQFQCRLFQILTVLFRLFQNRTAQTHLIFLHQILCSLIFVHRKLCSRRRSRSPKIRHIIRDRRIRLMPYCGNHRHPALKNRTRNDLFIECPQILDRSASAPHDHNIHILFFQHPDSLHDTFRCAFPLHLGRTEDQLYIRISSGGNIDDIPHRSSRRCRHDPDFFYKLRNRPLVLLCEHPHLFQLFF